MKIERIYCDMDGVLTDFVGGAAYLFGADPRDLKWSPAEGTSKTVSSVHIPLGITDDELWAKIAAAGVSFWENLEKHEWADDLWKHLNKTAPTLIASSPALVGAPESAYGKVKWLQKWRGKDFQDYILIRGNKHLLAGPTAVLIDDYGRNVKEFREAGGHAILFPRPWNENREFSESPIDYTVMMLD